VPIGAWHGNGRKVGWYSPYLLAAYDPDREEYQSVCRCMSGFTDAFYKESKARFDAQGHLPQKPSYYNTGVCPAAWQSCTLCMDLVT
jgi:DNA ligase 1